MKSKEGMDILSFIKEYWYYFAGAYLLGWALNVWGLVILGVWALVYFYQKNQVKNGSTKSD